MYGIHYPKLTLMIFHIQTDLLESNKIMMLRFLLCFLSCFSPVILKLIMYILCSIFFHIQMLYFRLCGSLSLAASLHNQHILSRLDIF